MLEDCTARNQKRTMGRKKIDIKKLENMQSLYVTFSKRRNGLFKKAGAFGARCGAEVAVVVFSPHGRPFMFGHPSVDSVISHLESSVHGPNDDVCTHVRRDNNDDNQITMHKTNYEQDLESSLQLRLGCSGGIESMTEDMEEEEEEAVVESEGGGFWWEAPIENMKLDDLKRFKGCLGELKAKVAMHFDEMGMRKAAVRDYLAVRRHQCGDSNGGCE